MRRPARQGTLAGMRLSITPVDGSDDDAIRAWCAVMAAVLEHDMPRWRQITPEIARGWLLVHYPGNLTEGYLARVGEEPLGNVRLGISTLENLDNLHCEIRVVPEARRHGFARQLHDFVLKRAGELGRRRLLGTTLWELPGIQAPSLAGVRFAESLGYRGALADVARRLDLSDVDGSGLDRMLEEARARSAGYRIVQWTGPHPDEYLDDLAYLDSRLLGDAPMGELEVEAPKPDPQRLRDNQAVETRRGRLAYHTGAVHEASDRLVAWTTLTREKSLDWNAFQQITIVEPEHRGHRLGALVKVENLRFFREREPTVTAIDTFNADENTYMISINEAMGFRPLYAFQNWQREI
jgi:GNAT superfamily N-acetyltransferase